MSSPFKPFRLQVAYGRWRPHLNRYLPYWQISMEQFIVFNIWICSRAEKKTRLNFFWIHNKFMHYRFSFGKHSSSFWIYWKNPNIAILYNTIYKLCMYIWYTYIRYIVASSLNLFVLTSFSFGAKHPLVITWSDRLLWH